MPDFKAEHRAVLDGPLLGDPRVRPGKMFGFPADYVGKKHGDFIVSDQRRK